MTKRLTLLLCVAGLTAACLLPYSERPNYPVVPPGPVPVVPVAPESAPLPAPVTDITPIAWPPPPQEAYPSLPPLQLDGRRIGYWSFDAYDTQLAYDPPDAPSAEYVRGNFGPMDARGCDLPVVSGGYTDRPWMPMSWLLPEYDVAHQVCLLKVHQQAGYTHFGTYLPFSRNQGVSDEAFQDALLRVHRAGLWNVVAVYGGDGESWDYVRGRLDALYTVGALKAGDILVTCWQCNAKYDPYPLAEITMRLFGWAEPKGLYIAQHWYSGTIAWWDADDSPRSPSTCNREDAARLGLEPFCDRFQFGQAFANVIKFQFQQFDPWSPIADERPRQGGLRGEVRDSLRALYGRTKLVVSEYDAQRREDQNVPEWQGDAKGLLLLSVRDNEGRGATGGFFNGARLLNGEWVH